MVLGRVTFTVRDGKGSRSRFSVPVAIGTDGDGAILSESSKASRINLFIDMGFYLSSCLGLNLNVPRLRCGAVYIYRVCN